MEKIKILMKNTTFYLVRHGLTDWNVAGRLQGQVDIPLNKKGEKQALEAAEKYFKNIHFDAVFSSDLVRAKRTAELITLNRKITIETTKILRERSFGPHEGKTIEQMEKELKMDLEKLRTLSYEQAKKIGFESDKELMGRFLPFVRELALAYQGKTILLVSHGSIIRVFLEKVGFYSREDSGRTFISNLAFVVFESDGVEFWVKRVEGVEIKS